MDAKQNNTNINLENYRKVVEAELELVRKENLNLKIVNCQLQEDLALLEEDFQQAQKRLKELYNDRPAEKSVPLRVVRDENTNSTNPDL